MARKSASRMKPAASGGTRADGARKHRGTPVDDESIAHKLPPQHVSAEDIRRMNSHRFAVSQAFYRHTVNSSSRKRQGSRRHARSMRTSNGKTVWVVVAIGFAAVALFSLGIGNNIMSKKASTKNATSTEYLDASAMAQTTRAQKTTISATGTYSRFMLYDGYTMEQLFDGNSTPGEIQVADALTTQRYEDKKNAANEQQAQEYAEQQKEISDSKSDSSSSTSDSTGLTSAQREEGKNAVESALNESSPSSD